MGLPVAEARSALRQDIAAAREAASREGTDKLPDSYGDHLLERELNDTQIRTLLEKKRCEGVTDQDIRSWWNLPDLERRLILRVDNRLRIAVSLEQMSNGRTPEEAAGHLRKHYPMFGDSDDRRHTSGEDRPLPDELRDRVNAWIAKRAESPEAFKVALENSSSYNALVRAALRAGEL